MITRSQVRAAQQRALRMLQDAGIVLAPEEASQVEVADFGLDELERTGLEIVTYINTDRYCAKELVMFPGQTCPEHRHPNSAAGQGKQETFRVRRGEVYLYTPGTVTTCPRAVIPAGAEAWFTARQEHVLHPGEQFTLLPDTLHWFQAGPGGAIVSEFSSTSRDEGDLFTDPRIQRLPDVDETR